MSTATSATTAATFAPVADALTFLARTAPHLPLQGFSVYHFGHGSEVKIDPAGPDDVKAWGDVLGFHRVSDTEKHGTFHEAQGYVEGVRFDVLWIDPTTKPVAA